MSVALPPERSGRPAAADLAERRRGRDAALAAGAWAAAAEEALLGRRRALRFKPSGPSRGTVLHLHGGGFRLGAPEMAGPLAEALAQRCQIEVVAPQYRLAPEHPFPCGLIDALAALAALRDETGDKPLILSGDSAGGGLAAALAVLDRAPIDGVALFSPWLDMTVTAPSFAANAGTDPMFSKDAADAAAGLYLQGFDPAHPLASPLHAPITAFPPTLISVGAGEVLRDDSLRFHHKLQAIGATAELEVVEGMEHVAVVRGLDMPGAAETFEAVAAFIDRIVG